MDANQFVCLDMFAYHSCYSWGWDENKNLYWHECSLSGCSFSEIAINLIPVGQTIVTGVRVAHIHEWDYWECTADRFGSYLPPWKYKRKCRACNAEQMAENLEKEK